jgi:hypothetical protein
MESVQLELPSDLLQQVRQEIPSEAALSQVVTEAIHMWLEKRLSERSRQEHVLQTLRHSGLVMTLEKQRALADAMMSPLHLGGMPGREDLEAVLGRLKVPLSEEIIIMRDEAHSIGFRGRVCPRSAKASRGEDLELEEPVCSGYSSAFHVYATLPGMLSPTLIRDEVVQMREPREKRLLVATGMMEPLHRE